MDHTTPYGLTPKQHHLLIARIWPLQAIRFIIPVVNLIWTFLENLRPGHPQSNCCCWLTKSCLTLWPLNCSMPSFAVFLYLLEFALTHVHWVSDAIQPSHPLLPPSPLAFNLSQHQGLFQWVNSSQSGGQSIGVSASASVLPMHIQGLFHLGLTGLIPLQSKGFSRVFSNTTAQKHRFFGTQLSLSSNSYIHT